MRSSRLAGAIPCLAVAYGCSSLAVDPIGPPGAFLQPCIPDPAAVFQVAGRKNNGFGNIHGVRMQLLVNGEYMSMAGPESVDSGDNPSWRHAGDIPNDGHARFRYVLNYKVGYGFLSITSRGKIPGDRYYHRDVVEVNWSSDPNHEKAPLPETFVDSSMQADERPRRTLILGTVLQPGQTGVHTDSAILTLSNGHDHPIFLERPTISLRANGNPVPELTIMPSGGGTPTFPMTVPANGSVDFDVRYSVNMDGTHGEYRFARIDVTYSDTIRSCTFGPIWLDGEFSYNPP